jgi:hypothetical protein
VDPKDQQKLSQGTYDDVWAAVRRAVGVEPLSEEMARIIGEERADEREVRSKAKSVKWGESVCMPVSRCGPHDLNHRQDGFVCVGQLVRASQIEPSQEGGEPSGSSQVPLQILQLFSPVDWFDPALSCLSISASKGGQGFPVIHLICDAQVN